MTQRINSQNTNGHNKEVKRCHELTKKNIFKKILFIFIFRERGRVEERERNISGCFSCAPYWGRGPQPRHVP